jgi:hypothetical protein
MSLFVPLLLVILGAILLKISFPGALAFKEPLGSILFLLCSAIMAGIGFWYPWYLCTYHSAPDDRYGFALVFAIPFYFVGAWIAGAGLNRLTKELLKARLGLTSGAVGILGLVLALIAFSPIIVFSWRLMTK